MLGAGNLGQRRVRSTPTDRRRELQKRIANPTVGAMVVALAESRQANPPSLREHNPDSIPLWCNRIDSGIDPVECPGTLAGGSVPKQGAAPRQRCRRKNSDIMVVGADHIQISVTAYLAPAHMTWKVLLPKTVHAEGGIVIFVF